MNPSNKSPATRDFVSGFGTHANASSSHLRHIDQDLDAAPKSNNRASRKHEGTSSSSRQLQEIRDSVQCDPTPRQKVREVLRVYRQVYDQLKQHKEARRGSDLYQATDRIDLQTRTELERMGKVVNSENRIGSVPGIEVGDEFKYRTELQVVGIHFKPMCGIDYMEIEGVLFATCVAASVGYDYEDKLSSDVVEYTGEGGNVISKRKKLEDQKMVRGNLALANSMRHQKPVRMIRGDKSLDGKGKLYVYCGLYLVEDYSTKQIEGKIVYKFRLRRMYDQGD